MNTLVALNCAQASLFSPNACDFRSLQRFHHSLSCLASPPFVSVAATLPPSSNASSSSGVSSGSTHYQQTPTVQVDDWLRSMSLECYTPNFLRHGLGSLQSIVNLSPADLATIGIVDGDHQMRLMDSLHRLRQQAALVGTLARRNSQQYQQQAANNNSNPNSNHFNSNTTTNVRTGAQQNEGFFV